MMTRNVKREKIILIIAFLDLFGVSIVYPLISKHAKQLGASPSIVGLLGSVYGGLQLFSNPLVGRWSDAVGRRRVLLTCLVLISAAYLLMGFSFTLPILLISRIILGMFKCSQDQCRTYLADCSPKSEHAKLFGRLNSVSSLGFILGPTMGGHIAEYPGGFYMCAFLCAAMFIISLGLGVIFLPELPLEKNVKKKDKTSWNPFAAFRFVSEIDWKHFGDLFLVRFLVGLGIMLYRSNFNMWLDYRLGVSTSVAGYMTSYSAMIGTLGGFAVAYISALYNNDAKLLLHTGYVQFLSIACLLFISDVYGLALCMAPLSLANACARVASTNVLLERGEGQKTGALLGLGASVLSLARMLAPLLGGVALEFHTDGPVLAGAFCVTLGILVMHFSPLFLSNKVKQSVKTS